MKTGLLLLVLALCLADCSPISQARAGAFLGTMMGVVAEESVYQQNREDQEIRESLRHQEMMMEQRRQTELLRQQRPPYAPSAPQTPLPRTRIVP